MMAPIFRTSIEDYNPDMDVPEQMKVEPDVIDQIAFKEFLASLSREAREVVSIIFNAPDELYTDLALKSSKTFRGNLKRYLLSNGWSHYRIHAVWAELKLRLREV